MEGAMWKGSRKKRQVQPAHQAFGTGGAGASAKASADLRDSTTSLECERKESLSSRNSL
jgi:hypothetical protein